MLRSIIRPFRAAAAVAAAALAVACGDDPTGPIVDPTSLADTIQLPDTLFDGQGYVWDIYSPAYIGNGTSDAYDGGMVLSVGGAAFAAAMALQFAGVPEIWIGPDTLAGLIVTRRVYVSPSRPFARYLDVFENRGTSPVSTTAVIDTNLGSDGSTVLVSTSTGPSGTFDTTDRWIVTDDADGTGDPTLLHVIQGPAAAVPPSAATAPTGSLSYIFPLDVAAGERVILMHFASQNEDRDDALRNAIAVSTLGYSDALAEMTTADLADVINWDLTP